MTTGKDVLDEYLEITLHLSERATWALVALAGFLALCFIVYAVLPRTGESRLAQRIEALKSWLGIPAASRAVTTLVFGLGLIFSALFAIAVIAAFLLIWSVINGGSADPSATPTQSLGLGALLVALLSAPFVIWRSVVAQKTVDVTEQGLITDRINAAVASLGAQKERKIEALDAEGIPARGAHGEPIILEETLPNMEVRIGAIYALERIARENLDFHVQIMEILCAYIRENSPASTAEPLYIPNMPGDDVESPREAWERWREGYEDDSGTWHIGLWQALGDLRSRITRRTDIQATLEVLGRRTKAQRQREAGWPDPNKDGIFVFDTDFPSIPTDLETGTASPQNDRYAKLVTFWSEVKQALEQYEAFRGYRLDLRNTNLQGYDLQNLHLNGARFDFAMLQSADLGHAKLQGTDLVGAEIHGANLSHAHMQGTTLWFVPMHGVSLWNTQMQGADLTEAKMQGTNLLGAQMHGANLWDAQMQGALLWGAEMQGANLGGAQISKDTDLSGTTFRGAAMKSGDETTMAQLRDFWDDVFADGSVPVPPEDRPSHWPAFEMDPIQFHTEWRKWQADPEGYTPPDPPED